MADQLATPQDLASLLDLDFEALPEAKKNRLTLLVECATAVVQAVVGQRIVAGTSTAVLPAPAGAYLDLPEWPVRSITSVSIDGAADSSWRLDGGRVWRRLTWRLQWAYPGSVAVTYEHGYPANSQGLQLARQAVLSLAAPVYGNPTGLVREQIDDYAAAYEAMATRMEASRFLKEALVAQYGRTADGVRIGG